MPDLNRAGTRSDAGRNCRDAFLSLAKTCTKLGIPVWVYLGSRLGVTDHHSSNRSTITSEREPYPPAAHTFADATR
jgi:hypothetical protein